MTSVVEPEDPTSLSHDYPTWHDLPHEVVLFIRDKYVALINAEYNVLYDAFMTNIVALLAQDTRAIVAVAPGPTEVGIALVESMCTTDTPVDMVFALRAVQMTFGCDWWCPFDNKFIADILIWDDDIAQLANDTPRISDAMNECWVAMTAWRAYELANRRWIANTRLIIPS